MPSDIFDVAHFARRPKRQHRKKPNVLILAVVLCLTVGVLAGFWLLRRSKTTTADNASEYSPEGAFIAEVYQTIQNNYWQQLSDDQLSQLFLQALSQTYGTQPELTEKSASAVAKLTEQLVKDNPGAENEQRLAQSVDLILSSLQPLNRSRLYSQTQKTDLENRVANRDTNTDLFQTLEVDKTASDGEIQAAYENKKAEVEQTATSEAEKTEQLAQVDRAYTALDTANNRERYAETKVEPTIQSKKLANKVYMVKITQFSPTTVQDLQQVISQLQVPAGSALILDLRDNVGGAIDGLPYFLAPFIGNNQYAYQFFSQGKTLDFKTKGGILPQLDQFKQMVVLINDQTQSSAEVMAATLKKYHRGIIVGTASKGWGTVERVFPLEHQLSENNTYSLFLVHSVTLDEAGEPIEGTGVKPQVTVTQPNWKENLSEYVPNPELISAVATLIQPAL
ncbi:hypothetical protein KC921_03480 [Candidatus Woesebacteria bacterium]|nr:hypothetical protein [Candidatus Woesebacteria bacterium]